MSILKPGDNVIITDQAFIRENGRNYERGVILETSWFVIPPTINAVYEDNTEISKIHIYLIEFIENGESYWFHKDSFRKQ